MNFPDLEFTDKGKDLQLKAMNGDSITFTKIGIGNGVEPDDISVLTQLNNMLYECGITSFENNGYYAAVHWSLDTKAVTSEFYWSEYGIFAKDSAGDEVLYAYAYSSAPQLIPSSDASSITQIEADLNICVGDAENVSAVIGEYSAYADKKVVEEHINNKNNPHNVTAEDIGLGNVENFSVNNAAPTFSEANGTENIESGERTSTLWGKAKRFFTLLINHINNKDNPHKSTAEQINAAPKVHTHSATDINSGVLPVARGGTGVSSISELKNALEDAPKDYAGEIQSGDNCYNFHNCQYIVENGIAKVNVTCQIKFGILNNSNASFTILTLPPKMHPNRTYTVTGVSASKEIFSVIFDPDGTVKLYSFGSLHLEKDDYIRFQETYPVA